MNNFSPEQRALIEKIIRENSKFRGNEDLLENFCSEIYKKSYLLLDSVSNIENLRNYLSKVADTSISNVLNEIKGKKGHGGPIEPFEIAGTPTEPDFMPKPKRSLPPIDMEIKSISPRKRDQIVKLRKDSEQGLRQAYDPADIYSDIEDPKNQVVNMAAGRNMVQRIVNLVWGIHQKLPEKKYFQLFYAKYMEDKKQAQIAQELGLSQSNLSRRYYELVKLVKDNL